MNEHNSYNRYPEYSDESPLSANGRFGRLSYFGWNCLLGLVLIAAILVFALVIGGASAILGSSTGSTESTLSSLGFFSIILFLILYVVIIYFTTVFSIRRLHDLNLTGWLCLLLFVPLINFFFMFYLWVAPGTRGQNDFGLPHETKGWEKILGWINILLMPIFFIGVLTAIAIPAYQGYVEKAQQQQMMMSQAQQDLQASETELKALEQELKAAEQGLTSASSAQSSY